MAILYKHFASFRTVFYVFFTCFCLLSPLKAQAEDAIFTVSDVKVDITAENSAIAREQAFAKAQSDAFLKLAERLIPEAEMAAFTSPDTQTISTMIKDFEVTQEQLSSVRYIGTYTFNFNDRNVRKFFSGRGVQFSDVSSRPVLALPFYQRDTGTVLWSQDNDWMKAWGRAGDLGGLVPVVVPIGDLMDVSDINEDQALGYDDAKLRTMLGRYNAGEAAVFFAVPDHSLMLAADHEKAAGSLVVEIYRTDRNGPEVVRNITVDPLEGETKYELYSRATRLVHQALQQNWKEKTVISPSEASGRLSVLVRINGLEQWAATQTALENVHVINEIALQSLSPSEAKVDLMFQGTEDRLRLALAQADITLSEPRFNPSSGYGGYGDGGSLVYELYLNNNNLNNFGGGRF